MITDEAWRPSCRLVAGRGRRYARSGLPLPFRSVPVSELFQNASDDQVALTICFAAMAVSGLIMYFSYHVGVLTRGIQSRTSTLRIPDQASMPAAETHRSREKAA